MLPCDECCAHYQSEFLKNPPQTESRDVLSRWLVRFHNSVNARLQKPQYSYDTISKDYEDNDAQCSMSTTIRSCGDGGTSRSNAIRGVLLDKITKSSTIVVLLVLSLVINIILISALVDRVLKNGAGKSLRYN
jgi:hypothetical protein